MSHVSEFPGFTEGESVEILACSLETIPYLVTCVSQATSAGYPATAAWSPPVLRPVPPDLFLFQHQPTAPRAQFHKVTQN
jgi:hypothetical protein